MTEPASPIAVPARRPWYSALGLTQRLVVIALVGYLIICVYLSTMQTRMIYVGMNYPISTEAGQEQARQAGFAIWPHTTPGAIGPQGFVSSHFTDPAPRGTFVMFHGNGEFAWYRADQAAAFTQRGFRVFLYEYPGYGGRPGVPSEAVIVPDARAVIRSLDQAGYGPIFVWGVSLGSGVAAAVCGDSTLPVHGLGLVTPWDDLANVGLSMYPYVPVRLLLRDKYDSVANLRHFSHPICVVRSEHDEIIPPALSQALYAALPEPKKIILHQGVGHNDWPSSPQLPWWDEALNFIAPPAGKATPAR